MAIANTSPHANDNLGLLFDKEEWSDITIKFSDREVSAHRIVLALSLEYFETLLKSDNGFKVCYSLT